MLALWYNGISARVGRARAAILAQWNGFVNSQNAQNTGKIILKLCAKYLLTKLPGRGIMVNSGRLGRGRPAQL